MTTTTPYEKIAQAAFDCFASLPQKCKPRTAADGRDEWTPLAAIMVVRGSDQSLVECVSLATGTKCLASNVLHECAGMVIHDSHAEILALRGFNRWLLQEIQLSLEDPAHSSQYIYRRSVLELGVDDTAPFRLANDLSLHMFTTEAPCGDASMELLIGTKAPEDSVPWEVNEADASMLGRGHFSLLGRVRRKPARADAPITVSKSCSDKLAIKQVTSLLSFPCDLLIQQTPNAFLSSLIVPAGQLNHVGFSRAFGPSGRMKQIEGIKPRFFDCVELPNNFPRFQFARTGGSPRAVRASNTSTVYIGSSSPTSRYTVEILLNGVKQGFKQSAPDPRKQSVVCRKQMWLLGFACLQDLKRSALISPQSTYCSAKSCSDRSGIAQTKLDSTGAMGGWIRNTGDETWTLD